MASSTNTPFTQTSTPHTDYGSLHVILNIEEQEQHSQQSDQHQQREQHRHPHHPHHHHHHHQYQHQHYHHEQHNYQQQQQPQQQQQQQQHHRQLQQQQQQFQQHPQPRADCGPCATWEMMESQEVQGFEVPVLSEEGRQVEQLFHREEQDPSSSSIWRRIQDRIVSLCGDRLFVTRIIRIQNPALATLYHRRRRNMERQRGGQQAREELLLHGTLSENVDGICREGFDLHRAGTNGRLFGLGIYLTPDSKLAHMYTQCSSSGQCPRIVQSAVPVNDPRRQRGDRQRPGISQVTEDTMFTSARVSSRPLTVSTENSTTGNDENVTKKKKGGCCHYMLLCSVLVGQISPGPRVYRRPFRLGAGEYGGQRFDSSYHVSEDGEGIYVVFRSDQVYPQYLVEYTHGLPSQTVLGVTGSLLLLTSFVAVVILCRGH